MKPILVKYKNETIDISSFIHKHPGGMNTLRGLENSDLTSLLIKGTPHSDAAIYLISEYKVYDSLDANNNNECVQTQTDLSMEVSVLIYFCPPSFFLKINR